MHPAEINRFMCKLRLIEHGLVGEVEELENIQLKLKKTKVNGVNESGHEGEEAAEESEEDQEVLAQKREAFMKRAIKAKGDRKNLENQKIEAVSEVRRAIIKEFMVASTKPKTCGRCKGVSPGWRRGQVQQNLSKTNTKERQGQERAKRLERSQPAHQGYERP